MKVGVIYPQSELPTDPATVRTFACEIERLGFRHILAFDHVLGADPTVYADWRGPYDVDTTFHEPLVFYGFLAAITDVELVTGIIIAPQRQTALLAKQAAEVDLLTGGRFRLGIGTGWNFVEYEALGQDFATRGKREEEQITLLRRLWTERSIQHDGVFDRVTGAGISPLPVQRPIPVWLGGSAPVVYRRVGRLADGWFPQLQPGADLDEAKRIVEAAARDAGRDPASIGMEGRAHWAAGGGAGSGGGGGGDSVAEQVARWREAGASHVSINTMRAELAGVDEHLAALSSVADALGIAGN